MVDELSKNLNKDFNKNHLKNRLKTLKDHFSQCYDIFRGVSLNGFAWNPETKLFEAEEEVWDALIAEKPDAAKWKKKQISNYNEMLELFAKDRATGAAAETSKERRNRMKNNPQRVETINEIDQLLSTNEISLENFNSVDNIEATFTMPPSEMKPQNATKSKSKKRKVEEEDAMNSKILSSLDNVANAIRESTKVLERSHARVYAEEEIYNELELRDLEPDLIADAYLFLVEKPEKARALFGCPFQMRKSILRKMMGAS